MAVEDRGVQRGATAGIPHIDPGAVLQEHLDGIAMTFQRRPGERCPPMIVCGLRVGVIGQEDRHHGDVPVLRSADQGCGTLLIAAIHAHPGEKDRAYGRVLTQRGCAVKPPVAVLGPRRVGSYHELGIGIGIDHPGRYRTIAPFWINSRMPSLSRSLMISLCPSRWA